MSTPISFETLESGFEIPTDGRVVRLSLERDGDKPISANFDVREFACHDGSDEILIDLDLVALLEKIRAHFGRPVTVRSGYRTAEYNEKIGGAIKSQHVEGKAADIVVHKVSPADVADYAESILEAGGVGRYRGFTHVDVRKTRARWRG